VFDHLTVIVGLYFCETNCFQSVLNRNLFCLSKPTEKMTNFSSFELHMYPASRNFTEIRICFA